ncbi:MAG: hypothetical protein ACRDHP_13330, partial [Ktedonobacterales bacterium]
MRDDSPPAEAHTPDEAPIRSQIDLDAALSRRRPLRARLLVVALLVALVAAVVAPLWRALSSRACPAGAVAGHTTALILSNVSTGSVILDGQRTAYRDALVLHLHPGINTIVFDAPPFRSRSCVLTWPAGSASDTCRGPDQSSPFYPHPAAIEVNGGLLRPDYIISFPLALPDLPAALRAQALGSVSQLLARDAATWPATVPTGEHYAASMNAQGVTTATIASVPLHATPTVAFDTAGTINGCADELCATTGGAGELGHPQTDGSLRWAVARPVFLGWRFASPTGDLLTSVR